MAGEKLFFTIDGGDDWKWDPVNMDERNEGDIQDIQFLDHENGWLVGEKGLVKKTSDGGKSWQDVESGIPTDLRGLFFLDPEQGWMAGDQGIIVKTERSSHV